MGPPCRDMLIRELPPTVVRELESQLNVDSRWIQLVDNIPKTLNNSAEFVPKYSAMHRSVFERTAHKLRGSPTRSVIEDWSCVNPSVGHLIAALERAGLYSSVRYLIEDFLKEDRSPPPPIPPPSSLSHLDLPPGTIDMLPSQFRSRLGAIGYDNLVTNSNRFQDKMNDLQGNLNDNSIDNKEEWYRTFEDQEGNFFSLGGSDEKLLRSAPPGAYDKYRGDNKQSEIEELLVMEPIISRDVKDDVNLIHHVTYSELGSITDDFNDSSLSQGGRVIGKGGFGTVYLGIDRDNKRVAIKRTTLQHDASVKQFKAELTTLSQHRHINLLPLLAYSCDTNNLCIVYDYMPSGSLEERLACKGGSPSLPAFLRIDIASGTGHAIAYLNSHGLVHRDVKSPNILLNEKFTPKLGDFATTRLGPSGASHTVQETTTVIGTPTYLAPEAHTFDISSKLDSFSFGVVLLELLTGLPAFDINRENKDLRSHVLDGSHSITDILDQSGGSWKLTDANCLYDIARRCLHLKKKKRVTVAEIIGELDSI